MNLSNEYEEIIGLINNNDYDKAKIKIDELIKDAPPAVDNVTHFKYFSLVEQTLGEKLLENKDKNVPYEVDYGLLYFYLGRIYYDREDYKKAIKSFKTAESYSPMNLSTIYMQIFCYFKANNLEAVLEEVKRLREKVYKIEQFSDYLCYLGRYYFEVKDYTCANALFSLSYSVIPNGGSKKYLNEIASIEHRDVRLDNDNTINEELSKKGIDKKFPENIVEILAEKFKTLKKADDICEFSRVLYGITRNGKYVIKIRSTYPKFNLECEYPSTWIRKKFTDEERNTNAAYKFIMQDNGPFSIYVVSKVPENDKLEDVFEKIKDYNIQQNNKFIAMQRLSDDIIIALYEQKKGTIALDYYKVVDGKAIVGYTEYNNNVDKKKLLDSQKNSTIFRLMSTLKSMNNNIKVKIEDGIKYKEYCMDMPDRPTFVFYFPDNIGIMEKKSENVFELRKDNKQKIRVMVSKKISYESFEASAKKWIDSTKDTNKQIVVKYEKEKINDIPIETYVLQYENGNQRIYKIGYVDGHRVTISGTLKDKDKEEIINYAFEHIKKIDKRVDEKEVTVEQENNEKNIIEFPKKSDAEKKIKENNSRVTRDEISVTFPIIDGFSLKDTPNRQTIFIAVNNSNMIEQVVRDGKLEENETLEQRVELILRNGKKFLEQQGIKNNDAMFYKNISTPICDSKVYVHDYIVNGKIMREVSAYIVDREDREVYQISISEGNLNIERDGLIIDKVDDENDNNFKKLFDILQIVLFDIKKK